MVLRQRVVAIALRVAVLRASARAAIVRGAIVVRSVRFSLIGEDKDKKEIEKAGGRTDCVAASIGNDDVEAFRDVALLSGAQNWLRPSLISGARPVVQIQ